MTPQERDLIIGLFQRLKPPPEGDIDGEARAPSTGWCGNSRWPYLLVRRRWCRSPPSRARRRGSPISRPSSPRPRLRRARNRRGGLPLGPARRRSAGPALSPASAPQPAAPAAAASPGPWGSRGAPSFLQSALSTAAGVAGGALLFQGIEHMLGYGGSPFANVAGAGRAQPAEDITVNNFETAPQDVSAPDPGNDPSIRQ